MKLLNIRKGRLNQLICAVIVNLGGMCYGIAESWSSPVLPLLMTENSPISPVTTEEASWLGSILFLGPLFSTNIFGYLIDKIGRKRVGYLVATLFLIGWLLKYFAVTYVLLLIGRLIMGLSSGGAVVLAPAYIGDTAEDNIRGTLASLFELFINVGILFVYIAGAYLSYEQLTIVCFMIPLIYLVGIFCIPESPVYLVSVNKTEEAVKSLRILRDGDNDSIDKEISSIKELVLSKNSSTSEDAPTIKDILRSRATRRGLFTGLSLAFIQEMSGIVAILSYTSLIFQESGSNLPPNISAICVGVVQLFGSFVSTAIIDRFGRRFLTIVSNAGMSLCLATLLVYFLLKSYDVDISSFEYIPVVFLCLYIFFYAFGMGPMPFVILSEMFSPKVQGVMSSVVMLFVWSIAFFVAKTFSIIESSLGSYSVYAFYLVFCIYGIIYGAFFLLETKNKSLETILKELGQEHDDHCSRNSP